MSTDFDRSTGIGGSDVAAILGLSPWRSRWDVWAEKTHDPSWQPQEESPEMTFGKLLEPVLMQVYERDHPGLHIGAGSGSVWQHEDSPIYIHLDGIVYGVDEGIWEGKTARSDRDWQDGVPQYYLAQVHTYLAVSQEKWCDVTVFFRDSALFEHYRVMRDEALEAGILQAVTEFWNEHVVPGIPPPVDGSPGAGRYINARFPTQTTDDLLPYDQSFEEAVTALLAVRDRIKAYEVQEARLVNVLKSKMGEYPRAEGDGWTLTWKRTKGATTVAWQTAAEAFKTAAIEAGVLTQEDAQTIMGLYTSTGAGSRPFVLRQVKGEGE